MSNEEFYDIIDDYKNGLILKDSQQETFIYTTLAQIIEQLIVSGQELQIEGEYSYIHAKFANLSCKYSRFNDDICQYILSVKTLFPRGTVTFPYILQIPDDLNTEDMVSLELIENNIGSGSVGNYYV